MIVDKACAERGCPCYDPRVDGEGVEMVRKEWVGLTDEELKPFCDENYIAYGAYTVDFIKAIEAKLKEKNT